MLIKSLFIALLFSLSACDRDAPVIQTATLTINNMTDSRILPLSVWSIYVTPTGAPALDRSIDLLPTQALKAGVSQTFTINTCGQELDILVVLSDGSEQAFTSAGIVDCDTTDYFENVI